MYGVASFSYLRFSYLRPLVISAEPNIVLDLNASSFVCRRQLLSIGCLRSPTVLL